MYYKKRDFGMSLLDDFFPCKGPSLLGPWLGSVNTSDQVMKEMRKDGVKTFGDSMRRYQCMDVYVDLRPGILRLKLNEALLSIPISANGRSILPTRRNHGFSARISGKKVRFIMPQPIKR